MFLLKISNNFHFFQAVVCDQNFSSQRFFQAIRFVFSKNVQHLIHILDLKKLFYKWAAIVMILCEIKKALNIHEHERIDPFAP